jgi:hypothetical protein
MCVIQSINIIIFFLQFLAILTHSQDSMEHIMNLLCGVSLMGPLRDILAKEGLGELYFFPLPILFLSYLGLVLP